MHAGKDEEAPSTVPILSHPIIFLKKKGASHALFIVLAAQYLRKGCFDPVTFGYWYGDKAQWENSLNLKSSYEQCLNQAHELLQ